MERIMITITLISASILSISLAFYMISMAMDNKRDNNNNKNKPNIKDESMTPRQKAETLYNKMVVDFEMDKWQSKQCALLAVDEILLNMIFWEPANPYGLEINKRRYWQKVKEELENI
jgi:hypothetical protein